MSEHRHWDAQARRRLTLRRGLYEIYVRADSPRPGLWLWEVGTEGPTECGLGELIAGGESATRGRAKRAALRWLAWERGK